MKNALYPIVNVADKSIKTHTLRAKLNVHRCKMILISEVSMW